MNILKRFLDRSNKAEVALIPRGKLFLRRPPALPKGASECLYNDALLQICETSVPHHYKMVVRKAYAEGEVEESDSEDGFGLNDEWSFLLDAELECTRRVNSEGEEVLGWNGSTGPGERFEFVVDREGELGEVERVWDVVGVVSKLDGSLGEEHAKVPKTSDPYSNWAVPSDDSEDEYQDAVDDQLQDPDWVAFTPSGKPRSGRTERRSPVDANQPEIPLSLPLGQLTGTLLCHITTTKSFQPVLTTTTTLVLVATGKFNYELRFAGHIVDVTAHLNAMFDYELNSFTFNSPVETWRMVVSPDALVEFQIVFVRILWEAKNQTKWGLKEVDEGYVMELMGGTSAAQLQKRGTPVKPARRAQKIEGKSIAAPRQRPHLEVELSLSEASLSEASLDEESEGESPIDPVDSLTSNFGSLSMDANSHLTVGATRTFVSRGNRVGVFSPDLSFITAIENLLDLTGAPVLPRQMKLSSNHMVIQGEAPSTLYQMDLTRGQIVEEWQSGEYSLQDYGGLQRVWDTPEVLGVSSNALLRLDPRVSGKDKLVETKQYASKTGFRCMATTESGGIAVASANAELRLYDRFNVAAKTALPALGDAIKHVDILADGRWVLATCDQYLLLVDTYISEGHNEGFSGFNKSFDKDKKPRPWRLAVKPEHAMYMESFNSTFTPARFNNGGETIVTSLGPFVITWSLRLVLKGLSEPYLIKRYGSKVVADDFKYGTDQIVVATADDVGIVKKKEMQKF